MARKKVEEKAVKTTPAKEVQTVNINGKDYVIDSLSDNVKNLLAVYNQWQGEREAALRKLNEAKIEVAKNEAALRDLSKEIVELVEQPAAEE